MYAHEVMADSKKWGWRKKIKKTTGFDIPSEIRRAQKFHLGDVGYMRKIEESMVGSRLFQDENGIDTGLPFQDCWFDFNINERFEMGLKLEPWQIASRKRGVLCHRYLDDVFGYVMLAHTKPLGWQPSVVLGFFLINTTAESHSDRDALREVIGPDIDKYPSSSHFTYNLLPIDDETRDVANEENISDLAIVNIALKLLNCKNISYQRETLPKNIRLIKKGIKKSLCEYHTLVITPTGKESRTIGINRSSGIQQRVHLCRGHVKRYTADRPLFGRYVGHWWWDETVRGSKKQGIVTKDYELRSDPETVE